MQRQRCVGGITNLLPSVIPVKIGNSCACHPHPHHSPDTTSPTGTTYTPAHTAAMAAAAALLSLCVGALTAADPVCDTIAIIKGMECGPGYSLISEDVATTCKATICALPQYGHWRINSTDQRGTLQAAHLVRRQPWSTASVLPSLTSHLPFQAAPVMRARSASQSLVAGCPISRGLQFRLTTGWLQWH